MMKNSMLQREIGVRQRRIQNLKKALKKEFIGIDKVIDQVTDLVSSWYLLPEIQDRPVVINLWGMTGVGKSSLVQRLVELLQYEEKYYRFNLSERNRYWSIKDQIAEIYANDNGYPIIIALDEFQHARTLDQAGLERDKESNSVIWELLDSGKFTTSRNNLGTESLYLLLTNLKYALSKGVKVTKGIVTCQKELFRRIIDSRYNELDFEISNSMEDLLFIPTEYIQYIFDSAREEFESPFYVQKELVKMDGNETIDFLERILSYALSPKTVDCTNSIIFVLGNLDEAYTMSKSYNPDISPDEFHKESLKINVSIIKDALRGLFRHEQIARLGNNHIIYPAFNTESFKRIIKLELHRLSEKIKSIYDMEIYFERSLINLIFEEGVYPSQGTRPVYSTIHQMIGSRMGKIISTIFLNDLKPNLLSIKRESEEIWFVYFKDSMEIYKFTEQPILNLSRLRMSKKDDLQSIVAVHEAGHAILSIVLLNILPQVIYSKTADNNSQGFVRTKFQQEFISKKEITPRIAYYLGGIVAERIVFGGEHITNGSESDIEKATNLAGEVLKQSGMSKYPISYQVKSIETNNHVFDTDNQLNEQVKQLILEAEDLAEKTLRMREELLVQMAYYLSNHSRMTQNVIMDYISAYTIDINAEYLASDTQDKYYREQLKQKYQELKNRKSDRSEERMFTINNLRSNGELSNFNKK